jgi:hypothetical protein
LWGIFIELNILGITDIITLTIIGIIIVISILIAWFQIKKFKKQREQVIEGAPADEIFKLVSKVKYPAEVTAKYGQTPEIPVNPVIREPEKTRKKIDLIKNRVNITDSMRALAEKYFILEITLASDDGLVIASSTDRDMQADAARYSQIVKRQEAPEEPGVSLFELYHKEAHIIGIIREERDLPSTWKKEIREDTKGILEWWL